MRRYKLLCGVAICAIAINCMAPIAAAAAAGESDTNDGNTATPIKHVIVIIGENRTFDHLFATHKPVNSGETVSNLLSKGIVKADGTPGANYSKVPQNLTFNTATYQIAQPPAGLRSQPCRRRLLLAADFSTATRHSQQSRMLRHTKMGCCSAITFF